MADRTNWPRFFGSLASVGRPALLIKGMSDILFLMHLPGIDKMEVKDYFEKQGLTDKYDELQKILDAS